MTRYATLPFVLAAGLTSTAIAVELPVGTVLDGSNIDTHLEATFEGHAVSELVPEQVRWAMREQGFTMRLGPSRSMPRDPRYEAASAANAARNFDAKGASLPGWEAGMPFPTIAADDPDAARKVIWNFYLGQERGDNWSWPSYAYVLIDGHTGLDRVQVWSFQRIAMKGRLSGPAVLEAGNVLHRTMVIAQSPSDIRGTGVFTIGYDDGKLSDQWAYLPDQRRSRRLSGSNWMNPIANTDILGDDFVLWDAHPDWYAGIELVGKRTILAVPNGTAIPWVAGETEPAKQFPMLNLAEKPYWNQLDEWSPREVFVIKATPPPEHPYGYKLVYFDTRRPLAYLMEAYDKSGKLLKIGLEAYRTYKLDDRDDGMLPAPLWAAFYDYQSMHATMVYPGQDARFNVPLAPDEVTLKVMEQRSR